MIRGVHHVAMNCRDLDRMVAFYRDAMGFVPVGDGFSWEGSDAVDAVIDVPGSAARGIMMKAGNCYIELFQYSAPPPASVEPKRPYDRGFTHLCIDVTDFDADLAHLVASGLTIGDREPMREGGVGTIYGYDPEGNIVEVQYCPPRNGFTLEELA